MSTRANHNSSAMRNISGMRRKLLNSILAKNDPLLLESIGFIILIDKNNKYIYEGKKYDLDSHAILNMAWSAAVCEGTNTVCGSTDVYVIESCAVFGICTQSREEALAQSVKKEYGEDGLKLFKNVYASFVNAIDTKNAAALINRQM